MVPEARLELAQARGPGDFESPASTNSTTPGVNYFIFVGRLLASGLKKNSWRRALTRGGRNSPQISTGRLDYGNLPESRGRGPGGGGQASQIVSLLDHLFSQTHKKQEITPLLHRGQDRHLLLQLLLFQLKLLLAFLDHGLEDVLDFRLRWGRLAGQALA